MEQKVPAYRLRLPSHKYGMLVGVVEQALLSDGQQALVHFRSDWTEGSGIWLPIRLYERPDGALQVYTEHEYIEEFSLY